LSQNEISKFNEWC